MTMSTVEGLAVGFSISIVFGGITSIWWGFKVDQEAAASRREHCDGAYVVDVGGCDQAGWCRVRLSNGWNLNMNLPIKGEPCR